jgi:CRISPR-associated protein Cst2
MFHLFGNILTTYGTAANNRGENEGNTTTLQKLNWKGDTHSSVSSEAIRWALRYYWQTHGYSVNRIWQEDTSDKIKFQDEGFDAIKYIDDDVLGFMRAEAAKKEGSEQSQKEESEISEESEEEVKLEVIQELENDAKAKKPKRTKNKKPQGVNINRRGMLGVTRAVSINPFFGDITFNATSSGKKGKTSLHSTEVHATRYQYGFAITPEGLNEKSRINAVLDGLISIAEVAGNHARFLYDFSPESIILRWTQYDASPRCLYCFEEDELGNILIPDLVRRVEVGDINPEELWIGGKIADSLGDLKVGDSKAHIFPGVKAVVEELKKVIIHDLQLVTRGS